MKMKVIQIFEWKLKILFCFVFVLGLDILVFVDIFKQFCVLNPICRFYHNLTNTF